MTPEEKAVIDAAYALRYALVTPGADIDAAQNVLTEAIDRWDIERAYEENARMVNGVRAVNQAHAEALTRMHEEQAKIGPKKIGRQSPEWYARMHEECVCSRTEKVYCQAENCHGGADVSDWVPATLLYCLAGDRIRIGADESDVTRSSSGAWHANVVSSVLPSGKTWDKITPWEHTELRLDLSANPGFRQYPPNTPCEIWMSAERRAVHVIMTGFPGSVIVDNSSVSK